MGSSAWTQGRGLECYLGKRSLEKENSSDFEKQSTNRKEYNNAQAVGENDSIHTKLAEFETLLETSGERNLRSINLTHGDYPCHCVAQTGYYPEKSNLCLIWDLEELQAIGLSDRPQKITVSVVISMLALRWIEENGIKYRKSKAPTVEAILAIDYSVRFELFETACKVFATPIEVKRVWSRVRFFLWFMFFDFSSSFISCRNFLVISRL